MMAWRSVAEAGQAAVKCLRSARQRSCASGAPGRGQRSRASVVRKQREMKAGALLMFSFYFSLAPPGHGMAALMFSGLLS